MISYQFLHAGFLHLGGNMLYLWVFGDNIEDAMGHLRFFFFYLLCGVIAALVHVLAEPQSQTPVIGASGAVSAILGAYLVLHPRAKVLVPVFYIPIYLPAWALLIFWFGYQVWGLTGQGAYGRRGLVGPISAASWPDFSSSWSSATAPRPCSVPATCPKASLYATRHAGKGPRSRAAARAPGDRVPIQAVIPHGAPAQMRDHFPREHCRQSLH